jgi:hypothetical protein
MVIPEPDSDKARKVLNYNQALMTCLLPTS